MRWGTGPSPPRRRGRGIPARRSRRGLRLPLSGEQSSRAAVWPRQSARIDQHEVPFRVLFGYFRNAADEVAPIRARSFRRDGDSLLTFHVAYCTKLLGCCGVFCRRIVKSVVCGSNRTGFGAVSIATGIGDCRDIGRSRKYQLSHTSHEK